MRNKRESDKEIIDEEDSVRIEESSDFSYRIMLNSSSFTTKYINSKKIWQVKPVTTSPRPPSLISEKRNNFRKSFDAEQVRHQLR